jgi:hypothetical protein
MFKKFPFIPSLLSVFIMKIFFVSAKMIMGFHYSIILMWFYYTEYIDSFLYIEPSLHPRNKSHVIMVCNPFNRLLNFVSLLRRDIDLQFSFLVAFSSLLGIRVMLAAQNELSSEVFPSLQLFGRS